MQRTRLTSSLATRYVAGSQPEDGVSRAEALLSRHGIRSSLFYLGEYVETPTLVDETIANKRAVVEALGAAGLDVHVSIDPTQVGPRARPGAGTPPRPDHCRGRRPRFEPPAGRTLRDARHGGPVGDRRDHRPARHAARRHPARCPHPASLSAPDRRRPRGTDPLGIARAPGRRRLRGRPRHRVHPPRRHQDQLPPPDRPHVFASGPRSRLLSHRRHP